MTSKYLDYKIYYSKIDDKINHALLTKKGDCVDYSIFTYTNYLYLIKNTKNTNLIKNVRIARGYAYDGSDGKYHPHQWIECLYKNGWDIFDPTSLDSKSIDSTYKSDIFQDSIDTKLDSKILTAFDKSEYYPLIYYWLDMNGNQNKSLNWKNILLDSRGQFYVDIFE